MNTKVIQFFNKKRMLRTGNYRNLTWGKFRQLQGEKHSCNDTAVFLYGGSYVFLGFFFAAGNSTLFNINR